MSPRYYLRESFSSTSIRVSLLAWHSCRLGEKRSFFESQGHTPSEAQRRRSQAYIGRYNTTYHSILHIVDEARTSWARDVVLQSLSHNLGHRRRFDTLWHRVLLHEESVFTGIEEVLMQLDAARKEELISKVYIEALWEAHFWLSSYFSLDSYFSLVEERKPAEHNNNETLFKPHIDREGS